ncbi:868_t:CDS:2 [Gigaspora margarita]|uniref:868_t:CDS:1 n=1 Tax=Gigaspora margarita TaxID=4874 RepID=A0ABM8W2C9_GIGMA|nr:868_t:CDS:2 [Gigaspora margarita]
MFIYFELVMVLSLKKQQESFRFQELIFTKGKELIKVPSQYHLITPSLAVTLGL